MSSNDQLLSFLAQLAVAGDGAIAGAALAFIAVKTCHSYFFHSSALDKVNQASNVKVSDLRQLLEQDEADGGGGGGDGGGEKLVVVRGIVQAKASVDGWKSIIPNALVSNEAGVKAVLLQNTQTCIYNEWRGLFGWTSDFRMIFGRTWKDQKSTSVRMVPFVLLDQSSAKHYLNVNMDDSNHPLPLSTVYHKLQPVQGSGYTFLQAVFGHAYPVGLLDEEKVLAVGKKISAVGVCSLKDGFPEIKSSQELPYFLTEMTKDQLVVDLAFKTSCLFWGGIILGTLSIGVLGYATMRNWGKWKEWRQRRQDERLIEAENEAAAAAEAAEPQADEVLGEIPDGELCVVCLMRRRRAAFIPCGHMVCCRGCAQTVRRGPSPPKCPVCRASTQSFIMVFSS